MKNTLREQASWLLLAFESGLNNRTINDLLVIWCKQLGRSVEDFFQADTQQWSTVCQLKPATIEKLEQAREKLTGQAFLVEQLQNEGIALTTVLDESYPKLLKNALNRSHLPPVLTYMGNLQLLQKQTIAIIGSRNAGPVSLEFTQSISAHLSQEGVNVISGYARGVDRSAFEGAKEHHTTVVLPHGIHKVSKVHQQELQPKIEAGNILLLSQFHPDAPWMVSRAMERNHVVTGLAQIVIVAESDIKGGTWEGAHGALKQKRQLYVRDEEDSNTLPGNKQLISKGGTRLLWPTTNLASLLAPIIEQSNEIQEQQLNTEAPPNQLSLLALQPEE